MIRRRARPAADRSAARSPRGWPSGPRRAGRPPSMSPLVSFAVVPQVSGSTPHTAPIISEANTTLARRSPPPAGRSQPDGRCGVRRRHCPSHARSGLRASPSRSARPRRRPQSTRTAPPPCGMASRSVGNLANRIAFDKLHEHRCVRVEVVGAERVDGRHARRGHCKAARRSRALSKLLETGASGYRWAAARLRRVRAGPVDSLITSFAGNSC